MENESKATGGGGWAGGGGYMLSQNSYSFVDQTSVKVQFGDKFQFFIKHIEILLES